MSRLIDLTGQSFGLLTVQKESDIRYKGHARWHCLCACGKKIIVVGSDLRSGHTKSCGCTRAESTRKFNISTKIKHGQAKHPAYNVRKKMIDRCYNLANKNYHQYGGRGIIVCQEWLNDPEAFITWAESNGYKQGLQIDRIDNNGNYEPSNCHFVTSKVNNRNRRDNTLITVDGITKTQVEWAEKLGVHFSTIRRHKRKNTFKEFYEKRKSRIE